MDEKTKVLVQESWQKVVPISDKAAELFYGRLFELDPTLKLLFKSPIEIQGKLLMKALDGAVKGLDDLGALVPVLQKLGARHGPYGVLEKDYETVGSAFLWTLEQGLGEGFTPEVKAAWTEVYGVVAGVMIAAQGEVILEGPVSPREIRLVQGSWALVAPISEAAAAIFYARLFEIEPGLKSMFSSDLTEQGKKLMQMLTVAVRGLDRLDEIVPAVQALGRRHAGYGVKDKDYDTVAEALLFTLDKGLGETFTDEVKQAWVKVYMLLANTMKAAAALEATQAPPAIGENAETSSAPEKGEGGAQAGIIATCLFMVLLFAQGLF